MLPTGAAGLDAPLRMSVSMKRLPSRKFMLGVVSCALLATALAAEPSAASRPYASASLDGGIDPQIGIFNIDHFIFIVQENRSFDNYFGTFPGADGIPDGTCIPDPKVQRCLHPYHDENVFDRGGPHNERASRLTIDKGQDGRRGRGAPRDRQRVPLQPGEAGVRSGDPRPERNARM